MHVSPENISEDESSDDKQWETPENISKRQDVYNKAMYVDFYFYLLKINDVYAFRFPVRRLNQN